MAYARTIRSAYIDVKASLRRISGSPSSPPIPPDESRRNVCEHPRAWPRVSQVAPPALVRAFQVVELCCVVESDVWGGPSGSQPSLRPNSRHDCKTSGVDKNDKKGVPADGATDEIYESMH